MSLVGTLPQAELIDSPADLLQAPDDVSFDTLEMESTKSPRRVKVYEMKGDAWSDRGTGFCQGIIRDHEAVFHVTSEESKDNVLLESKIIKDDLYQIQQNTLIVWQELDGTDVALSFQEEEGCLEIWNFLRHVQKLLNGQDWDGPEDGRASGRTEDDVSDDEVDPALHEPVFLPDPALSKLAEVEELVHFAMASVGRRESLAKFVLTENYVPKLISSLELAEDLESITDLHRLCNIVKSLILLNDAAIFERILKDDVFLGVAGILEYDPDFPNHKAEHRKYLGDGSKFKEVVEVRDPEIKRKIHQTFRLQYLKDVVLARILDDPTFSILNTLIFFNQVDIVQHFQHNEEFLNALFGLFDPADRSVPAERRADAILFVQQFTGVAKTLQAPARASLYKAFIDHGLFQVLVFSLGPDAPSTVRLAGTDIAIAIIDHDPKLIRGFIIDQSSRSELTLSETLVNLLISERDLGVKAQMAEAIRLLVDPSAGPPMEVVAQKPNDGVLRQKKEDPEAEKFLEMFYSQNILTLMTPLLEVDHTKLKGMTFEHTALFTYLCDLLCFFIRAHTFRSKFFILSQNISVAISRMFKSNDRHLHLAALRYFRICIGINDDFYNRHLIKNNLFEPIVDLLVACAHRDNLLNSAILEFFETIRREGTKSIVYNLVENYREKLESIKLDTARGLIMRYEQFQEPPPEPDVPAKDESAAIRPRTSRWQSDREIDEKEQAYFEQDENVSPNVSPKSSTSVPAKRPLVDVDYDVEDSGPSAHQAHTGATLHAGASEAELSEIASAVDDRIGEKRRRSVEQEDEDAQLVRHKRTLSDDGKKLSSAPVTATGGGGGEGTGGIASVMKKKKMLFSFGKQRDREEADK